jgi:hypothetical protein
MRKKRQSTPDGRIYAKGRSTEGWRRGERVTSLDQLQEGTVLVSVSHQFEAENLIRITATNSPANQVRRQIVYWAYVSPELEMLEDGGAIWEFELKGPIREYFLAVRE